MPGLRRRPSRACIRTCPASVNLQARANVCMKLSCCKTNVGSTTKVIYGVVPRMLTLRDTADSQSCSQERVHRWKCPSVCVCGGGACV